MRDPYAMDVLAALPCDRCGADVPVQGAGWTVECPRCFTRLVVPPAYRREEPPPRELPPPRPVPRPFPWREVFTYPVLGAGFAWTLGGGALLWLASLLTGHPAWAFLLLGPYLASAAEPGRAEPPDLPRLRHLAGGFLLALAYGGTSWLSPPLAVAAAAAWGAVPAPGVPWAYPAPTLLLGGAAGACLWAAQALPLPQPAPLAFFLWAMALLLGAARARGAGALKGRSAGVKRSRPRRSA